MKSYRKELWFEIPNRRGFVNITPEVESCLRESAIKEGLCLVNARLVQFLPSERKGFCEYHLPILQPGS